MIWSPGRRRQEREISAETFRMARRLAREDVTVYGEDLSDLHVTTLTTELDDGMRRDYQLALESYDKAKSLLAAASDAESLTAVDNELRLGRFHLACVIAQHDGVPPPVQRDSCFFNPQHGPARSDILWAPPGGVEREVAVCAADAERVAGGLLPAARMVLVGAELVPWWATGTDSAAQRGRIHHAMTQAYAPTHIEIALIHLRGQSDFHRR